MLDDIIVWWVDDDRFDVMPNASNTERVVGALGDGRHRRDRPSGPSSPCRDPQARSLLDAVVARGGRRRPVPGRPRSTGAATPCVVAGTGYTGEDGVEVAVPAERAPTLWDAVLAAGFEPAGLGARDTLRLEAGLPLHGHELGPGITPLQAGLGWVVSWDKGDFRGRAALAGREGSRASPAACAASRRRAAPAACRPAGPGRRRAGRRGDQRQLLADARAGHRPGLRARPTWRPATRSTIDVRAATQAPATVVKPPFVARLTPSLGTRAPTTHGVCRLLGEVLDRAGRSTSGCGRRSRRRCGAPAASTWLGPGRGDGVGRQLPRVGVVPVAERGRRRCGGRCAAGCRRPATRRRRPGRSRPGWRSWRRRSGRARPGPRTRWARPSACRPPGTPWSGRGSRSR